MKNFLFLVLLITACILFPSFLTALWAATVFVFELVFFTMLFLCILGAIASACNKNVKDSDSTWNYA